MMSEAIEQRGCHFGIAEDTGPFAKIEVCGDHDGGSLVQAADQMEQKLAPGLGERQIAEFVEDNEVHAGEVIGNAPLASCTGLGLEPIDEIHDVVKTSARPGANAASGDGDGKVGLAGAGSANQHGVALLSD